MGKRKGGSPRKNTQQSNSPTSGPQNKDDHAPRQVPLISPSPSHTNQANSGKEEAAPWWCTWSGWKRALEIIGIASGIGYAVITYCMWRDSGNNFDTDQRAWMMLENISGNLEIGKPYMVEVSFKNFGKTPAMHATIKARMELLAPNQTPDFRKLQSVPVIANIAPSQPFSAPIKSDTGGSIEPDQITIISSGEGIEDIFGRVDYDDIFGTHHWTEFCYYLERDVRTYSLCPGDLNKSDDNP